MKKKQPGFTIVELLIATTVFSVVMVICLAAFLRVGQLYYKGIYLSRTQEVTRNISDDIVNQLRLNGNPTPITAGGTISGPSGTYNVYYFCAGSKRYSFMSNNVVNSAAEANNNFGLVRDNLPATGCKPPVAAPAGVPLDNNSTTELLGDKMRMVASATQSDLYVTCTPVNIKLACVHVHVDFGDNDLLVSPNPPNNSFTTAAAGFVGGNCSGPLAGSQFCATTDLDTTVYPLQ